MTIILYISTFFSLIAAGVFLYLLKKMDQERIRMENFLADIGGVLTDYYLNIDSLFEQNIHYYDETIFQFIESTKQVKNQIDDVLKEYDELKDLIIQPPTQEEKNQRQQVEVLGVVKPTIYPIRKV